MIDNPILNFFGTQFLKFIAVGIVNTLFSYFVFALAISVGLSNFDALLLATILGLFFNFKTIGKFVFGSTNVSRIIRFFVVYAILFLLNYFALKMLKKSLKNDYVAQACILPVIALVSFSLNKKFVFLPKTN